MTRVYASRPNGSLNHTDEMLAYYPVQSADELSPPEPPRLRGPWFQGASTMLVALSPDGVVIEANPSAVRFAEGDVLVGSLLWETRLVRQLPAARAAVRDAVAAAHAGRRVVLDLERYGADGVLATAEFTLSMVGGKNVLLAEGRDVSRSRAAERERRDLLRGASQQLRTPLAGVHGALATLDSGDAGSIPAEVRGLLRLAQTHADLLSRCVTDLLDLERVHSGAVRIAALPTSAVAIGCTAIAALMPLARERGVHVTARDDCAGRVLADHDHTAQALATLLSHTIHAAPPGTTLRVVITRAPSGCVRLAIEDPSAAIAVERRAAFASPRHGAGHARGSSPAMTDAADALAVALARALVERQGGALGPGAADDRSTVCWLELPAAQAALSLVAAG